MEDEKYKNGKIYKIISNFSDQIYIGSTTQPLNKRHYDHKKFYKRYLEGKCNRTMSSEIIKLGETDIILIESYPCENKNELHKRERYWIEKNRDIITNKGIPSRPREEKTRMKQEYYERNKKRINARNESNKEHIRQVKKEYNERNKEHIRQVNKEYNERNKEHIQQVKKEYFERNKEHILQAKKEKINCECGSVIRKDVLKDHLITKKHLRYSNAIETV